MQRGAKLDRDCAPVAFLRRDTHVVGAERVPLDMFRSPEAHMEFFGGAAGETTSQRQLKLARRR